MNVLSLVAVSILLLGALNSVTVTAHRGSGSPDWDLGNVRSLTEVPTGSCGTGFPCSPAPAVFYPGAPAPTIPNGALNAANDAFNPTCNTVSPQCIPNTIPLSQASPWFGTPPPSGIDNSVAVPPPYAVVSPYSAFSIMTDGSPFPTAYHLPNPCSPSPFTTLPLNARQTVPYYGDPTEYPVITPGQYSPVESMTNLNPIVATPNIYVQDNSVANTPFNGPPRNPLYNQYSVPPGTGYGTGRFHLTNQSVAQSVFDVAQQANTLFFANGNPNDVEGAPDNRFVQMGHDGYLLGKWDTPVVDRPGYDFQLNMFQPAPGGTACVYGATASTGPFTLVHSMFDDGTACDAFLRTTSYCPKVPANAPACPGNRICMSFDLSFYYTPLRTLKGEPSPGEMDYFLVVTTFQHTPFLQNKFHVTPDPAVLPQGTPLRPATFSFNDDSIRFGYPLWFVFVPETPPLGHIYPDPLNTRDDAISEWNWDFTSDPYSLPAVSTGAPPTGLNTPPIPPVPPAPQDRLVRHLFGQPTRHNVTCVSVPGNTAQTGQTDGTCGHKYVSPGVFPACHSVHTSDQIVMVPTTPVPTPVLTVWRQSDPPASDPWPVPPNRASLPPQHRTPDPINMYCKAVTVWNQPPTPLYSYTSMWGDPETIRFYDTSVDTDWVLPPSAWVMPPSAPYGPIIAKPYGCCACPDCPPDGIQLRTWDFQSDGVVDANWNFVNRLIQDGNFCTDTYQNVVANPCPSSGAPLPANAPGDPLLLRSGTAAFTAADVDADVYGPGVAAGTTIVAVLSPTLVRLSAPVYADSIPPLVPVGSGMPLVIAKKYTASRDDPQFLYPRPGEYNATLRICDHDYTVSITNAIYGSAAWPAPNALQKSVHGDSLGTETFLAPTPSPFTTLAGAPIAPDTPLAGTFHNLHGCQALRQPVRIANNPPHITVPPTLVVRPGEPIRFTVFGSDSDPGQVITLRLCAGTAALPGMAFDPVTVPDAATQAQYTWPGQRMQQTFRWTAPQGFGRYGPICFEITDGIQVTHALTSIWVVGATQDTDADGIADLVDNCPSVPNHDQADANGDHVGDACQETAADFQVDVPKLPTMTTTDHDGDGIADLADNCPSVANRNQADADGDGVGDMCDLDGDGDGIVNTKDNCPTLPNPLQEDTNHDGRGDICAALGAPGQTQPDLPKAAVVPGDAAPDSTWRMVLGSSLGLLAMVAILVPVLLFALRRRGGERGDR